jgi:hypothetical protein
MPPFSISLDLIQIAKSYVAITAAGRARINHSKVIANCNGLQERQRNGLAILSSLRLTSHCDS